MQIAIVMLHYGAEGTTQAALKSLSSRALSHPLFLINNTASDLSHLAKLYPHTKLIDNHQNLGFAHGVNQGINLALAQGAEAVLLLNNDITIKQGNLTQLANVLKSDPMVGAVAPLLVHPKGYDWGASRISRWSGLVRHRNWPNPPKTNLVVSHASFAAILLSSHAIKKIGLLNEKYFMYYEDLDYSLRLALANYKIVINPQVEVMHNTSSSSSLPTRLLYQWRSHLTFVTQHIFSYIYPTAYLYDLVYYPLIILKSLLFK